jgi:hypothetical protein
MILFIFVILCVIDLWTHIRFMHSICSLKMGVTSHYETHYSASTQQSRNKNETSKLPCPGPCGCLTRHQLQKGRPPRRVSRHQCPGDHGTRRRGSLNDRRNAHKSRTCTRREQRDKKRVGAGRRSGGVYQEEPESFETVAGDDVNVLTAARAAVVS